MPETTPQEIDRSVLGERWEQEGVVVLREICDRSRLAALLTAAERVYLEIHSARDANPPGCVADVPAGVRSYRPTASSMLVESIAGQDAIGELLAPLNDLLRMLLHDAVVCNLDQAWLRRQYPAKAAPAGHHPHGWHQDGALGFDFTASPGPRDDSALLPILTAWIPLTACGEDAPGLEYVARRSARLLPVEELSSEQVHATFPDECFHTPRLQAGDVILFWGDVVHRTHLTATMNATRTSIEFRFLAAERIPDRIANDRYLPLT